MADLWFARVGRRLAPTDAESEEALRRLPESGLVRVSIKMPRSPANHRHLFSGIAAAARGWPEFKEPFPDGDGERLRAWLLVQAGYCDVIDFPAEAADALIMMMQRERHASRHVFVRRRVTTQGPMIQLLTAKSIAWSALGEREFQDIKEKIDAVVLEVTGASLHQWVTGDREAA